MFTAFATLAFSLIILADLHNVFELLVPSLQMGMMNEHGRGPIKCCETIALDMLHITRAEELVHHPAFHVVDVQVNQCQHHDTHGGRLPSRAVGGPIRKNFPQCS